ncbi:MAG: efflux RND transporter periplasmic adaptor subunit [candidate division Zixibacteria bacterium]|nr:efflux RND transporter periplasmic adaptor subunit [candidate division Zixibacteria bacterium]
MAKSKKKKIVIVVIVVAVLVVLGVVAVSQNKTKAVEVQVDDAETGEIVSVVTATGNVKARTEVNISADVMGRIIDLPVKEGQEVKTGDLLVQIDPTSYRAKVSQYKAALKSYRAQLEKAQLAYERNQALFKRNLISKEELDFSRSEFQAAEASVRQFEAQVEQARDELAKTTIRSPIDGTITALYSEKGENVVIGTMNNPGTVIMVVSDLSAIEVEAEVDETDIALIETEQHVDISLDAFPDTTFNGKVTDIGNSAIVTGTSAQNQVVNFLVTILIQDDVRNIRPGMSATVDIVTAKEENVVKVPIQAIVMRKPSDTLSTGTGEKDGEEAIAGVSDSNEGEEKSNVGEGEEEETIEGVFVVNDDNTAKFVPVVTGIADQRYIEVKEGLEKGKTIVTGSYKTLRTLKSGDAVEVEKRKNWQS